MENVRRHGGREVRLVDAAIAWALQEAGLKELGKAAEKALEELENSVKKLSRGEAVAVCAKDIAELKTRIREIAHKLRLLFKEIVNNAEKYAESKEEAEAIKKAFTVTKLAEKLAEANSKEFYKLWEVTLADKVVAFFESLARGTAWSRVVLNAAERGKAYEPLVYTPARAYDRYKAGTEDWGTWGKLLTRLARVLVEEGIKEFTVKPESGAVVKVLARGKEIAEVEVNATGAGEVFYVWGELAERVLRRALDFANSVKKGEAEPYQAQALMATDGGYEAKRRRVKAVTTSALQAAIYKMLGMKVYSAGYALLTDDGLKPGLIAQLPREKGAEWVELIRSYLEKGVEALSKDRALRGALASLTLGLLSRIDIAVEGADEGTEEGRRKIAEVRRAIVERVEYFARLRLGEGGKVYLAEQLGKPALTYEYEAYARVIAPLLHYIAEGGQALLARHTPEGVPKEDKLKLEVLKFLAQLILYDGHVDQNEATLAMGHFGVRKEEKKLPLDVYDKVALFITMAALYNIDIQRVYVRKDKAMIYFSREFAREAFAADWAELLRLLELGRRRGLYADHIFDKLLEMREYVEEWANNVKIEHVVRGDKITVYFKDKAGREIAHINVGWTGESLLAKFKGARERAERLAAILNALGASAEARKDGANWSVRLYTDSIAAIRRPEWLEAVRTLVEELYKNGRITKEQRDRLLKEIEAGPNVVEVAGVEMGVNLEETAVKMGTSKKLVISYKPRSPDAYEAAVKALKAAGFEEGLHFTAKAPEGGEKGYIYLKKPAGLWKLEELRQQGVEWAKRALDRLEEIARARGFYDLLEEYLRPAREAETVDPRDVAAEDKERGIRAVIKDVKLEWENGRPRIVVEYEASGRRESFSFIWGVYEGVKASVRLNEGRAAVLATLTGDEKLKGKRGSWELTAKHLFALAKYKGVGWELLWWYAKAAGV